MSVNRILVCFECKEYCDIDKSYIMTYNKNEYLKEEVDIEELRYERYWAIVALQFFKKHIGHYIEEVCSTSDKYDRIIYGKNCHDMNDPLDRANGYNIFKLED